MGLAQGTNQPPRIATGAVAFDKLVLDTTMDETHAAESADFDGDGDLDIVATDFANGLVRWYRNELGGVFTPVTLDPALGGAYPVGVVDLDQDGDVDVLAAGFTSDLFVWYENDGLATFTRHVVDVVDGPHSLVPADLDADGDLDLVATSQNVNRVAWYENDGAMGFTEHLIDALANGAKRAEVGDIDGDGDLDIVAAANYGNEILWYENDGATNFTIRVIDDQARGAYYVVPTDLDRDGDVDLLAALALDDSVVWYEHDGGGGFVRRLIDGSAGKVRTAVVTDLDGDGYPDPLVASVEDDTVAWHANHGGGRFTKHVIDGFAFAAYGVSSIDIDADGDLDVISACRDSDEIALHKQLRRHHIAITDGQRRVIGSAHLRAIDADDGPADLTYTLEVAPSFGQLELAGAPLTAGGTFTQDDINQGRVAYRHAGANVSSDRLAFTVRDGGEAGVRPARGDLEIVLVAPTAMLTHLPLDEGAGLTALDASSGGSPGTLVNGPVYDVDTADGSAFSVAFDGVDDRIDLGTLDPGGQHLTVALWFKADSLPGWAGGPRLISKAKSIHDHEHILALSAEPVIAWERLNARVRVGGLTHLLKADRGNLRIGAWHHAALTHDGAVLRLYLDGAEVGSMPLVGTIDTDPTMPMSVGSQPAGAGGEAFHGHIDDLRIEARALGGLEIAALANVSRGRFDAYGVGLAGSGGVVPWIHGTGDPALQQTVALNLADGLPGAGAALLFGMTPAELPLFGGTLHLMPLLTPWFGALDGAGAVALPLPLPNDLDLVGCSFFWQGLVLDPGAIGGVALTPGLELNVGW